MKKWLIRCLTVLAMVCLIPGIVLKAAAETTTVRCKNCGSTETREILGYRKYDSNSHRVYVTECQNCHNDGNVSYLKVHTGGTETPTCTTGKTCEKCGGEYGILGHIWGDWQSNGDNTHTRPCQRDGCGAVETGNCNSSTAHCGTYGTCAVCGGTYFHADHTFPARWDWRSDTDVGRDAEYHWVRCLYCTEGKTAKSTHCFSEGNMHLKSPATCVSKPVYYKNCGTCYYKGTETYVYEWGNFDPNNHTEKMNAAFLENQEKYAPFELAATFDLSLIHI